VARTPVWCDGPSEADTTFYVASSGAGVFDAGSLWFDCGLGPGCGHWPLAIDSHTAADPVTFGDVRLERVAENLLAAMVRGRFG
jgi:hypothetical protein